MNYRTTIIGHRRHAFIDHTGSHFRRFHEIVNHRDALGEATGCRRLRSQRRTERPLLSTTPLRSRNQSTDRCVCSTSLDGREGPPCSKRHHPDSAADPIRRSAGLSCRRTFARTSYSKGRSAATPRRVWQMPTESGPDARVR